MFYRRIPHNFAVKNGIHGRGVFASEDIKKGEVVFRLEGRIVKAPTRTSVQIGDHKHIEDKLAGLVNHSCTPSAEVDRETKAFISLKPIRKGEEVTFNYNANEDKLASPFACECCGRKISGKHASMSERASTNTRKAPVL